MGSLLTDNQLTAFSELAKQMIAENRPTSSIKVALCKQFDLNQRQVTNQLWRLQIMLGNRAIDRRVLSDLSDAERAEILGLAASALSDGKAGDEIRAMLCEKFKVSERTVSAFCMRNGIDIRDDHSKQNAQRYGTEGRDAVEAIELDDADYDPSQDVFKKAAKKLREKKRDVWFDEDRDQWWLDHRPVSRVDIANAAGMGC